jgi:hypothetical protein
LSRGDEIMAKRVEIGDWYEIPGSVTRRRVVTRVVREEDDQGGRHYRPVTVIREATPRELASDLWRLIERAMTGERRYGRSRPTDCLPWVQWLERGCDERYWLGQIVPELLPAESLCYVRWPQSGRLAEYGVPDATAAIAERLWLHRAAAEDCDVERIDLALRAILAPYRSE